MAKGRSINPRTDVQSWNRERDSVIVHALKLSMLLQLRGNEIRLSDTTAVENEKGEMKRLKQVLGNSPKVVFRFSQISFSIHPCAYICFLFPRKKSPTFLPHSTPSQRSGSSRKKRSRCFLLDSLRRCFHIPIQKVSLSS